MAPQATTGASTTRSRPRTTPVTTPGTTAPLRLERDLRGTVHVHGCWRGLTSIGRRPADAAGLRPGADLCRCAQRALALARARRRALAPLVTEQVHEAAPVTSLLVLVENATRVEELRGALTLLERAASSQPVLAHVHRFELLRDAARTFVARLTELDADVLAHHDGSDPASDARPSVLVINHLDPYDGSSTQLRDFLLEALEAHLRGRRDRSGTPLGDHLLLVSEAAGRCLWPQRLVQCSVPLRGDDATAMADLFEAVDVLAREDSSGTFPDADHLVAAASALL